MTTISAPAAPAAPPSAVKPITDVLAGAAARAVRQKAPRALSDAARGPAVSSQTPAWARHSCNGRHLAPASAQFSAPCPFESPICAHGSPPAPSPTSQASQSTIHPLDTIKVRLQAARKGVDAAAASSKYGVGAAPASPVVGGARGVLSRLGSEAKVLYRGVGGAASGAGLAIGTYFAFYGVTTRALEEHTDLNASSIAFVAGAAGALGSSIVKVPAAVCIRSVQAGIYQNVIVAASTIHKMRGVRGLYTGYLPAVLEDVPDMAVKFAAYETMRNVHAQLTGKKRGEASRVEDLIMGGTAGALAAAATTPLDVVKTRMMCAASSRPTVTSAVRSILAEGRGAAGFFTGVGPRALSNGLNSAVFFCFFEAIRTHIAGKELAKATAAAAAAKPSLAVAKKRVRKQAAASEAASADVEGALCCASSAGGSASVQELLNSAGRGPAPIDAVVITRVPASGEAPQQLAEASLSRALVGRTNKRAVAKA